MNEKSEKLALEWLQFLNLNRFDFTSIKQIDLRSEFAVMTDLSGNKFSINFNDDRMSYHKKKSTLKQEIIGRAMGAGRHGLKILDLSAGLAIDAVFLCQLGFVVKAIERNPLIYLALKDAIQKVNTELNLQFFFGSAQEFLQNSNDKIDVIYFDPMFPEKKKKSARPRQEMVFFKTLVGADEDAEKVLELALASKKASRVVVKRPLQAPFLLKKPESKIEGKLIRFDIYGVNL
jgi:16S rRNA (guanine1516-N2)-methyltransferase